MLSAYLVRSAGFAFERLAPLRMSRAVDAVAARNAASVARLDAGERLDKLLSEERYAENPAFDDPAERKRLSKLVKQVRAAARQPQLGQAFPAEVLGEVARVVPRVAPLVEPLLRAHEAWREAAAGYDRVFGEELERSREAIRALYRDDEQLREAVFLESADAHARIEQLVETGGPRNSRARQRERLAALYAQRFCAKNDTNSMCGPHGVAYVGEPREGDAHLAIAPGITRRATYVSHWAAQRLLDEAAHRAGDAATLWRLHPTARIEGDAAAWCVMDHDATSMFRRRYARSQLPEAARAIVGALGTWRPTAELLARGAESGLDADDVTGFLEQLAEAGLVLRGPLVPPGLFAPLRYVAEVIGAWPESEARTWGLGEVAALEEMFARFAVAPLAERIELYRALAARFEESTGAAASRGSGQHYADRSILHEDACVTVDIELGRARAVLERPLALLTSALSLPLELARERMREWFGSRFGDARVSALDVHRAFDEDKVLETPARTARADALRTAIANVQAVIAKATDGRIASADLAAAIAGVPDFERPGYVSVDVMLAGASTVILGEVHGFFWLPTCLLDVLPPADRDRVVAAMRDAITDLAGGLPTAETTFLHTQATDRRFPLATTDLSMLVPTERGDAIDFGALDMRLAGNRLAYLDGDREVLPLLTYTRYPFMLLTSAIAPLFDDLTDRFFPTSLLPAELHGKDVPRLALDDLVFSRRSWRRNAAEIRALLDAPTEAAVFAQAQALRALLGCGPRVFVSVSGEPKPILLDFENLFLVEALVNMLERQPADGTVRFSEMLPDQDELVARGPDGRRTSELRMGFYRT